MQGGAGRGLLLLSVPENRSVEECQAGPGRAPSQSTVGQGLLSKGLFSPSSVATPAAPVSAGAAADPSFPGT